MIPDRRTDWHDEAYGALVLATGVVVRLDRRVVPTHVPGGAPLEAGAGCDKGRAYGS